MALSLLARSRSVAHSLKPDEEIGRPYACAQLACERLKKRLNLPAITSRPPCPPRVYKKLYNYLASALPDASTSTPREPQTPRKNSSAPASARTTPKTPTTARRTPQTAPRTQNTAPGPASEPPAWIMPAIRVLARTFAHPAVSPHVYTGVESLLPLVAQLSSASLGTDTPSARNLKLPAVSEIKLCSLVVAVFLYVLVRALDAEVTPEQYDRQRDLAVRTLLEAAAATADVRSVKFAELVNETEEMMATAQQEGWLEMEWFLNVVLGEEGEDEGEGEGGGDEMEGVETVLPAQGNGKGSTSRNRRLGGGSAYVGLGTMLQEATDYLGEQRREEYKTWKAGIMARCDELEAGA